MFSTLADAIELCRKAIQEGKEIFIFPPDLNPAEFMVNFDRGNGSWSSYDRKVTNINSAQHSSPRTKSRKMAYRE